MCSKPGGGTSQYLRTFFFFSWRGERLGGGGESGWGRLSAALGGPARPPGSPGSPPSSPALSGRERVWVGLRPGPGMGWFQGGCSGQGWTGLAGAQGGRGKGGHQGGRGRKRSSHQSTVLLFSASGQRFAGGGGKGMGRGDWGPLSSPHITPPPSTEPGRGEQAQVGPLGPAVPPKPPHQKTGSEDRKKGQADHFLVGETELGGGWALPTPPPSPKRAERTEGT